MKTLIAALTLCLAGTLSAQHSQSRSSAHDRDGRNAEQVIKNWKEKPQKVAREMMKKYGAPDEVTEQRLIWHKNGPWKRTELINEEIDHAFPLPHKDMLYQVIDFQVPAEKFSDIAAFDGSVVVERTRGELGARCDKEAANLLAVNLAQQIATGKMSVEQARQLYTDSIIAFTAGQPVRFMEKLQFNPQNNAGDPGKMTMDDSTAKRVKQRMKEMEEKKQ